MGADADRLLELLISELEDLAAPAERQIERLEQADHAPVNALALELNDAVRAIPLLQALGKLSASQAQAIRQIGAQLSYMDTSSNARLWTADGLSTAFEWETVRTLAHRALRMIRG